MNIKDVLSLQSWADRINALKQVGGDRTKEANRLYYDGTHPILTDPDRLDVVVTLYEKDTTVASGKKEIGAKTVIKTRKVLNYPVQLIGTLASFVFGSPPDLILNTNPATPEQTKAFQKIKDVWKKEARLDEHNKALLRTVSVETNAAELFFNDNPDEPKNGKLKVMLLSKENGDDFWSFFNDSRDMEAFVRRFNKKIVENGSVKEKTYEEIWTADRYFLIDVTDSAVKETPEKDTVNPYGKIPVIYYDQKKTEWWKIQNLINTMEKMESQLSDVNTRVGHAAVKITGELINMPDATQDVKVYQIKPTTGTDGKTLTGDVAYLESQTAPESVKLELDRTEEEIYKFTNIPDLYQIFMNDTNDSGKALKIRLFPVNIIIDEKKEIYAPGLDRRVSLLKTMLEKITGDNVYKDLDISVQFNDYIPEDVATTIDNLMSANGNKPIIAHKKSVEMYSVNKDAEKEYVQIKTEIAEEAATGSTFGTGITE